MTSVALVWLWGAAVAVWGFGVGWWAAERRLRPERDRLRHENWRLRQRITDLVSRDYALFTMMAGGTVSATPERCREYAEASLEYGREPAP